MKMTWMDTINVRCESVLGSRSSPKRYVHNEFAIISRGKIMKSASVILVLILLVAGCSKPKTVTDELSAADVKQLIASDTLYEEIILEADAIRKAITDNIVLMSKFSDLSYDDYRVYKKATSDTTFLIRVNSEVDSVYQNEVDAKLAIYSTKIDSQFSEFKKRYVSENPDNYFRVEFKEIEKEYYEYSNGVKSISMKFEITPLLGKIEGGAFHYDISPKVTGKSVASGGCRWSVDTKKPTLYTWEAPYDVEGEFKGQTTGTILDRYTFSFRNSSVRIKGKTYTSLALFDIPIEFRMYFEKDTLSRNAYRYILANYYKVEISDWSDLFLASLRIHKKQMNGLAYEFEELGPQVTIEELFKHFSLK